MVTASATDFFRHPEGGKRVWQVTRYIDRMRGAVPIISKLTASEFLEHFEVLERLAWLEKKASLAEQEPLLEWRDETLRMLEDVIRNRPDPAHIDNILNLMVGCYTFKAIVEVYLILEWRAAQRLAIRLQDGTRSNVPIPEI